MLLAIEVAWRWMFGGVALLLLWYGAVRLQHAIFLPPEDEAALSTMSVDAVVKLLADILVQALPLLRRLLLILVPALSVLWIGTASVGRTFVLSRIFAAQRSDAPPIERLLRRLVYLNVVRVLVFYGLIAGYVLCSAATATVAKGSIALSILVFLGLFAVVLLLWSYVNWWVSLAPLVQGERPIAVALTVLRTRGGELSSVAWWNGLARFAAGVVFTIAALLPLPLLHLAPALFWAIEVVVALAYCVVSDFLLLGRLASYAEIARQ